MRCGVQTAARKPASLQGVMRRPTCAETEKREEFGGTRGRNRRLSAIIQIRTTRETPRLLGLRGHEKGQSKVWPSGNGGAEEDRTPDLRIANATLSQLSYRPSGRHCKGLWGKREVTIAEGRLFVLARRQVLTPAPLDAGARGFGGLVRMPLQPLSCGPWRRYGPSQANSDLL